MNASQDDYLSGRLPLRAIASQDECFSGRLLLTADPYYNSHKWRDRRQTVHDHSWRFICGLFLLIRKRGLLPGYAGSSPRLINLREQWAAAECEVFVCGERRDSEI